MKREFEKPTNQDRQMRFLSQSIRLKESASPGIVRATMLTVSLTVLAFLVWAAAANVHEIARSPGEIIPTGHARVVQHLEGGMVKEILVRDGDHVKKGQVLARIDGSDTREDLERTLGRKAVLDLQEERLRAFIEGRAPKFAGKAAGHDQLARDTASFFASMKMTTERERDIINEQIRQKKQSIGVLSSELKSTQSNAAIVSNLLRKRQDLNRQGILSDVKLLETEQRHNELQGRIGSLKSEISMAQGALSEYQSRLQSLGATQADQAHRELDSVLSEKVQNDDMIEKLQSRMSRLAVTAPVDGIVKGLAVRSAGNVIQPGQVLMEIIPTDEKMIVSLKIPPRFIGHIHPGQPVQVKFSSYDFARYGSVPGTLQSISATTFNGEQGERFYEGRVALRADHVGKDSGNRILPGMTVMADIVTGDKTILQYLLKPIQTAMSSAFTER